MPSNIEEQKRPCGSMLRTLALLLGFMFLVVSVDSFSAAPAKATDQEINVCKLENRNGDSFVNIGWPRNSKNMKSLGVVNILVVGIDFMNALEKGNITDMTAGFDLKKVEDFYFKSSYGNLSLKFELVPEILHLPISDTGVEERTITRNAVSLLPKKYELAKYDAIVGITTASSSYSSRSASAGQAFSNADGQISNSAVLAGVKPGVASWTPWKVMAHEIGHLFGLMDLWDPSDSLAWQGLSAAPFDLMSTGAGWDYAPDFFAWEKWLLGWISDTDVQCISAVSVDFETPIGKLSDKSGIRLVVINYQGNLFAVENRVKSEIDVALDKSGLLVYRVDLSKRNFQLPISLVPSDEAKLTLKSNQVMDWQRNKLAPMADLETLDLGGIRIGRLDKGTVTIAIVSTSTRSELQAKIKSLRTTITPEPGKAASPAPKPAKYKNCTTLNRVYSGGVSKSASARNKGGKLKFQQFVSAKVYALNKSLDRDNDGLACER